MKQLVVPVEAATHAGKATNTNTNTKHTKHTKPTKQPAKSSPTDTTHSVLEAKKEKGKAPAKRKSAEKRPSDSSRNAARGKRSRHEPQKAQCKHGVFLLLSLRLGLYATHWVRSLSLKVSHDAQNSPSNALVTFHLPTCIVDPPCMWDMMIPHSRPTMHMGYDDTARHAHSRLAPPCIWDMMCQMP